MNILIITRSNIDRMPGHRYFNAFVALNHCVTLMDYASMSDYNPRDFNFAIYDDNADYNIYPHLGIPCFYLGIDTTIEGGNRCVRQSQNLDIIFYAQKIAQDKFKHKKAIWLPNAFDSIISNNNFPNAIYHINHRKSLIGSIGEFRPEKRPERIKIKDLIVSKYNNYYFIDNIPYKDIPSLYGRTVFIINPTLGDINLRTFEACGYGAINVTNPDINNGMEDLGFIDGENCILYNHEDEAIEKIDFYKNNMDLAEGIAIAGKKLVNEKHTYIHRANDIINHYMEFLHEGQHSN